MTAFWATVLLLPSYDLPNAAEADRFPPLALVVEWYELAEHVINVTRTEPKRFGANNDAVYDYCCEVRQILSSIWTMHNARPHNKRGCLKHLRKTMPPRWWVCPALIEVFPYGLLPRK